MKPYSQSTIPVNSPITGIILAGGASRRMGQAKALLPWGQSTLIQHLSNTLQSRVNALIIAGDGFTELPSLSPQIHIVHDSMPYQGPLAGLGSGLRHAPQNSPVFLTGCDFPFIRTQMIDLLFEHLGDADAVVAQSANVLQPLCGIYQPRIFSTVNRLLAGHERSMTALLDAINYHIVPEVEWLLLDPSRIMLTNINTPEEYQRAHQHYQDLISSSDRS